MQKQFSDTYNSDNIFEMLTFKTLEIKTRDVLKF